MIVKLLALILLASAASAAEIPLSEVLGKWDAVKRLSGNADLPTYMELRDDKTITLTSVMQFPGVPPQDAPKKVIVGTFEYKENKITVTRVTSSTFAGKDTTGSDQKNLTLNPGSFDFEIEKPDAKHLIARASSAFGSKADKSLIIQLYQRD
jgi:hypothetical protein